jgi:hypothetical protein
VRSTTGFHADQARWQVNEKLGHLVTTKLLLDDGFVKFVDAVDLEYILGQVDAYSRDFHGGYSCLLMGLLRYSTSAHNGAV